jgi:hypothetical protein
MAQVILKFDAVEEQDDIQSALNGYKWKLAMYKFDNELRSTVKYGSSALSPSEQASGIEMDVAEAYRERIRSILSEFGLLLD